MKPFKALALAGLLTCLAAPVALAAPATIADEVAAFAKPTQAERLTALKALLDAHGLAYEVQPFSSGKPGAPEVGHNVVVTLGKGDKDILLTAHYDAVVLKDGKLVDGLVDNAGSVVAIVHAADALKSAKLKHRLRVVFFDQEELGLLGAHAYAAGPDAKRVAGVINFDVNAFGDTPFFADGASTGEAGMASAARRACLAAAETCVAFPTYPPSDHLAFRKVGIPATSFSYMPAKDTHQLWLFMNSGKDSGLKEGLLPGALGLIHTPADTMAAVEPATVDRAAKLAVEAVKAFDAGR